MQRLPLGKYVAGSILLWSLVVFLHCAATNYGGLIALRFFLGVVESTLVPAMEMTMGMFFKEKEQAVLQSILWTSCMGAPIPAGFIAYGLLWSQSAVKPWKFFMIITGGIALFPGIFCNFYYSNNPSTARFTTLEEKVYAVRRIHLDSEGSIEQKTFKVSQL